MGGERMKTQLSPFVYKVKGCKNYLFFNSLKKEIFIVNPEGNPLELEAQLLDNDLVIETDGVIPFKFKPNVEAYESDLILRELQLRVTGKCPINCTESDAVGKCKKNNTILSFDLVEKLAGQLINFQLEQLVLVGGNMLQDLELLELIRSKISASNYKILCPSCWEGQFKKEKALINEKIGFTITDSICNIGEISEKNMPVDVKEFFYNQQFNPCWGNKFAIDINGDIKPCLWSERIYGNLNETLLLNLVLMRICDELWKLTKDKFDTCKECEFRYLCSDCRVMAEKETGNLFCKTPACTYCPDSSEWL
jgi:radical SAM protein with 4Fe4S-binding SPASM domain